MSGRRTKLPDGKYQRKDGSVVIVQGGIASEGAPVGQAQASAAAPAPDPFASPGAQEALQRQQEGFDNASGASGEGMRDAFLNAGTAGAYGRLGIGGDPAKAAREHPYAAMAGAVASPLNKLPGGGGAMGAAGRVATRTAAGANYADTIDQDPVLGGMLGGAMGAAGEAASGVGNALGRLGPYLKARFGPVLGAALPIKGTLSSATGAALQTGSIPVSEAVSAAKAQEDEEARVEARKRAGL